MNFALRICIVWVCICANIPARADVLPLLTGMFPPIFPTDGLVKKILDAPKDLSNVWNVLKMPTLNNQITVSTTPYVNVSRKEKIHSKYYTNIKEFKNRSKRSKTTKTTDELIAELIQLTSEESNERGDCYKTVSKMKKLISQLEPILLQISHVNQENVKERAEETTQNVEEQTPGEVETQIVNTRNSLMLNSETKHSEEATTERYTSTKRNPETPQPSVIECSSQAADAVHKKTRRHNSKFHKKSSSKAIKESDEESLDESELETPRKRRGKKKKTRHVRDTKYSSTTPAPIEEATEDNPRNSDESTTTESTTPSTVSTPNSEYFTPEVASTSTPTAITENSTRETTTMTDSINTKKSEEEINDSTVATILLTSTNNPFGEVTTAKIDTSIQPTSTDSLVENSTIAAVTEENKIETTTESTTTNLREDKNVEKSVEDKVNFPKSTRQDNSTVNATEGAGTLEEKSRRKRSGNKPTTPGDFDEIHPIKDQSKLEIDLNELPDFFRTLSIQQAINQGIGENHKPAPIPLTIKLDDAIMKPVKSNTSLENRLRSIEKNYQKIQKRNKILRERQKMLEERLRRE